MKKIDIEATVVGAYRFFFHNIISIIGTVWFPALILVALVAGCVLAIVPHAWLTGTVDVPDAETFLVTKFSLIAAAVPLVGFAGLVIGAMIRVGILERALGIRTGRTLFYFSLGLPVWRMVAAEIVAVAVVVVLMLAEIAAGVAAHFAISAFAPGWVVVLFDVVQVIALIVLFVYVGVRLFVFLPAVVVAESRIDLGRSWALGHGNAGRMIVVFLAVIIPVSIVTSIINDVTVLPIFMTNAQHLGPTPTPDEVTAFFRALMPFLPVFVTVQLLGALVSTGTCLGAIGTAYKSATAEDAS